MRTSSCQATYKLKVVIHDLITISSKDRCSTPLVSSTSFLMWQSVVRQMYNVTTIVYYTKSYVMYSHGATRRLHALMNETAALSSRGASDEHLGCQLCFSIAGCPFL